MGRNKEIIVSQFEYDGYDLAVAFNHVAQKRFGPDPYVGVKMKWWHFRDPVTFVSIKTGLNQEVKVPIRTMRIPGINSEFNIDGPTIHAFVDKSHVSTVENFLAEVKNHLETASIYKGKAITSSRGFLDLSGINFDALVYNERVLRELNENLWVLIEKTEECLRAGASINRKVLFEGKFGTGKTLAILLTAKKAIENGFTFFYVEPTASDISKAVEFMIAITRKYKRTVLAIEDFDREQRAGDPYAVGRLMMAIDGMLSKDSETIILYSTNFSDKIAGGFKRPGRVDKTVSFNTFNSVDAERLLKIVIPPGFICPKINWDKIGNTSSRMTPAFVKEVGTGSVLAGISRAKKGETPVVTEDILLNVIEGLEGQHRACEAAQQLGFHGNA